MKRYLLVLNNYLLHYFLKNRNVAESMQNKKCQNNLTFCLIGKSAPHNTKLLFNFSQLVAFFLLFNCSTGLAATYKSSIVQLTPIITESGTPGSLNTTYGSTSASSNFSVSGSNMLQGILVTPPVGFEVGLDNVTFSPTVTVGAVGNIPPTTVYIRLTASTAAGSYSGNITLSSSGSATVNVTMPNSVVSPASLTIMATDVNKTYGQILTGGGGSTAFTTAGLQNGETVGSTTIGYGPGSAGTDGVGTYMGCVTVANATGGTFNPANYNINYLSAQIIVNPAPLSIIANNVTKPYGQTLTGGPGSTAFTSVGLQNGETIGSVTIGYGSGSAATDGVGTYTNCVTVANGTGGNFSGHNYIITHVSANIIVVPATLTITADDVTKTYGQTLTQYSGSTAFTVTGLQNGETVSSVSIYYGTGGQANYPLQPCNLCVVPANAIGTFDPKSYTINYVPGNIIVVPALLLITADDQLKLYGEPNPPFTLSYTGFVNGEGPAQLTTAPTVVTTATTNSPVGQYPITVMGASDPDYIITYSPGVLTITDSFHIPNAFTPNGDSINDTWNIPLLDNYKDCTVNVYNRFGQNIYFSNGYGIPWDGTYKGSALPSGTYYYVIKLKNINKTLSGYVLVIR